MPTPAYLLDFDRIDYAGAHRLQTQAATARHTGALHRDLVMLLEHPPVFTLGRRGGRSNLNVSEAFLKERGIAVEQVERGGDITFHGPGQLVAYLIVNLNQARLTVTDFVTSLEKAMIQTAAHWQVTARNDTANRGVWVGQHKLGSVGITVRRGITFHGLALNINTDLTPFTWINPCGLPNCRMTTLAQEAGAPIDLQDARHQLARYLAEALHLTLAPIRLDAIKKALKP